jgi:hypothetical protein
MSSEGVGTLLPGGVRAGRIAGLRSAREALARPASVDDLLSALVGAAAPIVAQILHTPAASPSAPALPGGAVLTGASYRNDPSSSTPAALLAAILHAVLGASGPTQPGRSTSMSVNRFSDQLPLTRPFIFGVDDALLASLAGPALSSIVGPLVQALPALVNSANQRKLQEQAGNRQLITDLLSEVDRTLLLEQLAQARTQPPAQAPVGSAAPSDADLAAIARLLQGAATAPAPVTGTPPPAPSGAVARPAAPTPSAPLAPSGATLATAPVRAQSAETTALPSRAQLRPVLGPATEWAGASRTLFAAGRPVVLRYRLDAGSTSTPATIPRAKLRVVLRERGNDRDLANGESRITSLRPGAEITVSLSASDLAGVPTGTEIEVLAELRWPTRTSSFVATSASTVVLAPPWWVRSTGEVVGEPVELSDMTRFRSFWNRVWESAPATGQTDGAGSLWGIDAKLRYSVVLTSTDRGNATMETKALVEPDTSDSLRRVTRGRLKSGLEVSVTELNGLLPLFPGGQPLAPDRLTAFSAPSWLAAHSGDGLAAIAFDGRRRTRGTAWVVPVSTLRAFTLSSVSSTDAFGQVVGTVDENVRFPVVESIRVLGLTSTPETGSTDPGDTEHETGSAPPPGVEGFHFDGFEIVSNQRTVLEPAHVDHDRRGT